MKYKQVDYNFLYEQCHFMTSFSIGSVGLSMIFQCIYFQQGQLAYTKKPFDFWRKTLLNRTREFVTCEMNHSHQNYKRHWSWLYIFVEYVSFHLVRDRKCDWLMYLVCFISIFVTPKDGLHTLNDFIVNKTWGNSPQGQLVYKIINSHQRH